MSRINKPKSKTVRLCDVAVGPAASLYYIVPIILVILLVIGIVFLLSRVVRRAEKRRDQEALREIAEAERRLHNLSAKRATLSDTMPIPPLQDESDETPPSP